MSSTSTPAVTTTPTTQFVGQDIQVGGTDGTVGFFGKSPVAQGATVATIANDASGTLIATSVNALIARLQAIGIIGS